MTLVTRVLLVMLTLSGVISFSQDQSNREFLIPVDEQKRQNLTNRYALEMARYEYFAKPGRIGIYEFDIEVLEKRDEAITITPFNGLSMEIVSLGIWVNPDSAGNVARWRGVLSMPDSTRTFRVRFVMGVWSIDADGNRRKPDRNREIARRQLEKEESVIQEDSYVRRNERLVYGLFTNEIRIPATKTAIAFQQLGRDFENIEDFETIVVYEVDEEKVIYPADDSRTNPVPPSGKQLRRIRAYEAHIEKVKRELGLPLDQE